MTTKNDVRRLTRGGGAIATALPWFDEPQVVAGPAAVWSGWVSQGARVKESEGALADLAQVQYAVAVSSCTAVGDLDPLTSPVSEHIAKTSVLLPMFHSLSDDDQQRVAHVVWSARPDPHSLLQ